MQNYKNTFYLIGSAVGPHPYPQMIKEFQSIISKESKNKFLKKKENCQLRLLRVLEAEVTQLALLLIISKNRMSLIGVEPEEAASLSKGVPAVLHGYKSYVLLDEEGNPEPTHSMQQDLITRVWDLNIAI